MEERCLQFRVEGRHIEVAWTLHSAGCIRVGLTRNALANVRVRNTTFVISQRVEAFAEFRVARLTADGRSCAEATRNESTSNPWREDCSKVELDAVISPFLNFGAEIDERLDRGGVEV